MPTVQSQESLTEQPVDIIFPAGNRYSEEPPLETELPLRQIILLLQCLEWRWRRRDDWEHPVSARSEQTTCSEQLVFKVSYSWQHSCELWALLLKHEIN